MFRFARVLRCLVALGLIVSMSACATYQPPPPAFHAALKQPYQLDAGDRLAISVFEQPNLSRSYTIDKSGNLSFPLIGTVRAKGRKLSSIQAEIQRRLGAEYLRDPKVSAEIDQYRPFFIMGQVGTPGQYSYVPGMTVQNAIAIAGGYTPRAFQGNADITRTVNGEVLTGRVEISEPIMPGDTIYLRERLF